MRKKRKLSLYKKRCSLKDSISKKNNVNKEQKQLTNPYSSGGGGFHFESQVQASFVALMLAGGYSPCLPCKPIIKIKLQGKFADYETDDLIVFVQDLSGTGQCKLLGQVKHSISINETDETFSGVIKSAWKDYNNTNVFTKGRDVIALITGPLSATDTNDVRTILEWARHAETSTEFFEKVKMARFSSKSKQKKLNAFRVNINKATRNNHNLSNEEVFEFLKHFYLLGYDLDIKEGVTLALLHSLIGQYSPSNVQNLWARLLSEVQSANINAGTISLDTLPEDILSSFKQHHIETIPDELTTLNASNISTTTNTEEVALTVASLIGSWDENNMSDLEIIRGLLDEF